MTFLAHALSLRNGLHGNTMCKHALIEVEHRRRRRRRRYESRFDVLVNFATISVAGDIIQSDIESTSCTVQTLSRKACGRELFGSNSLERSK